LILACAFTAVAVAHSQVYPQKRWKKLTGWQMHILDFQKLTTIQKINYLLIEWLKIGFCFYGVFSFIQDFA
jgi:hypothetical protein